MKNITQRFKLAAVAAAAMLLSGCLGATSAIETRSYEELRMFTEGRMYRGYVDRVAPPEKLADLLENYPYSDQLFFDAWKMTKEEAADMQYIVVTHVSSPGRRVRNHLLADREWKLAKGDIIDYRGSVASEENVRQRKTIPFAGIAFVGNIPYITTAEDGDGALPGGEGRIVLGVVCRADEAGCDYNSSQKTAIGIGRVLAGADDYRGVEAESRQEMWTPGMNFAQFWGIPVCLECDEETAQTQ